MNEITAQNIIEALGKQDERIVTLEKLIAGQQQQLTMLPDYRDSVAAWNKELVELNKALKHIKLPALEIMDLKKALSENTMIRKNPPEVRHHHYVPKLVIATCSLFLVLVLVAMGWYRTAGDLKRYKASDIQLRHLKLTKDTAMKLLLYKTDSLYRHNPDRIYDSVVQRENAQKIRFELSQQAQEKESEARQLREKAKRYQRGEKITK